VAYWLLKSEPSVYSIDDLKKDKSTFWEGVRNYQARNNLRAMKKGDRALFYHSNAAPAAVVGIVEISKTAYPDPTQFLRSNEYFDGKSSKENPRWSVVDIRYIGRLKSPVPLEALKKAGALSKMVLVNNSRLSVQPVSESEWQIVLEMGDFW
jgi:predicted RNA-binding protein with PUA-like domain